MSGLSSQQTDFDIWEFVTCARCHLPFIHEPGAPPQMPFWITECGHIVCNNHLNADQSCAHCNAPGIQLLPLQREMDMPMSGWFCSVPHAADGVAAAAKFQQETMAALIRYYRQKCSERGALINRLKGEAAENKIIKKEIQLLRSENEQLRQRLGYAPGLGGGEQPSDVTNANGKRPMTRSSSPRSIFTPITPNRLTLPANQRPPTFPSRVENGQSHRQSAGGLMQHYAYVPPQTPRFHGQALSHAQAAPIRHSQLPALDGQNRNHVPATADNTQRSLQRGSFKLDLGSTSAQKRDMQPLDSASAQQQQRTASARFRRPMEPPPLPPQANLPPQGQAHPHAAPSHNRRISRTLDPFPPSTSNGQCFIPQAPSGAPQHFIPGSAVAPRTLSRTSTSTGQATRMAFSTGDRMANR